MINEYYRPKDLDEAYRLLSRKTPSTRPLGGGTQLSRDHSAEPVAVVDLQALGLDDIVRTGEQLRVGATTTLQAFYQSDTVPEMWQEIARREAALNKRNAATAAGTLASGDGRSWWANAMLAVDARLVWLPGEIEQAFGDWLPLRNQPPAAGLLISRIVLPLNVQLFYDSVERTPASPPELVVMMARWPSGRSRVVLGGYAAHPILILDGPDAAGAEQIIQNACSQLGNIDISYSQSISKTLIHRLIQQSEANQ
ncbi:MAG: hypothetical protein GYA17_02030 [Chloroflexi bacterium]|nr:hypothetical protein [Chloroflexota bacterium]